MAKVLFPRGWSGTADGAEDVVETFDLEDDLYALLHWARSNAVELRVLEAGPTGLDDVFRAISST
jgi:ABC-2 type transport system ATP-binding protein